MANQDRPRITDPKALRALAHPLRWQLLEIVGRDGTATATQCAKETGESVANCSYHLNLLAKYHYVEQAEGGQGREKPWRMVERSLRLGSADGDADSTLAVNAASGAFLDYELNKIRERLQVQHLEPAEWRESVGLDQTNVYLTAEEVTELRAVVRALMARFDERQNDPAARPDGSRPVTVFVATTVAPQHD